MADSPVAGGAAAAAAMTDWQAGKQAGWMADCLTAWLPCAAVYHIDHRPCTELPRQPAGSTALVKWPRCDPQSVTTKYQKGVKFSKIRPIKDHGGWSTALPPAAHRSVQGPPDCSWPSKSPLCHRRYLSVIARQYPLPGWRHVQPAQPHCPCLVPSADSLLQPYTRPPC